MQNPRKRPLKSAQNAGKSPHSESDHPSRQLDKRDHSYLVVDQGFILFLEDFCIAVFKKLDNLCRVSLVQLPGEGV